MLDSAAATAFLKRQGWLSRLPAALQSALIDVARLRRLATDEKLFAVGDPPGGLFGLASGCVALEAVEADGAPRKSYLTHPGTWMGEGPVAGLDVRMLGAWATRPSAVMLIEAAAFRRVAAREPELWRHLALLTLENHARTIGLAQDLMRRGSRDRLIALLARLAGLRDAAPPSPAVVDATQSEIAAIANLSRGLVSTLLQQMERDGLVRLRRAEVEVLDPARLLTERDAAPRADPV